MDKGFLSMPCNFILYILIRRGSFFVPLTQKKYSLKKGKFYLDLYKNRIKSG